jgi:chromosome segregation ATPase
MKTLTTLLLLTNLLTLPVLGNTTNEDMNLDNLQAPPELISNNGKGRIREHLLAVEKNITLTQANLDATQKNMVVLESELKDLEALEQEHLRLKERYKDFLTHATKENEKNNKAIGEIESFEKKVAAISKGNRSQPQSQLSELETAKTEKNEREGWRKDAQQKTSRIQELLLGIEKNLKSISARKAPLLSQLETWKSRHADYQNLLSKLNQKKLTAERFIASPKDKLSE